MCNPNYCFQIIHENCTHIYKVPLSLCMHFSADQQINQDTSPKEYKYMFPVLLFYLIIAVYPYLFFHA